MCISFDTRRGQGPDFQRERHHLITRQFLEEIGLAIDGDPEEPVRLDPFQYLINVHWGHPFLALGFPGVIGRSPNGVDWTRASDLPGGLTPFTGAYGNGVFLVGEIAGGGGIFRSNNGGGSWEQVATPLPGKIVRGMQFGNGRFVVAALEQADQSVIHTAVSSDNGDTWQTGGVVEESASLSSRLAFSGGKFMLPGVISETIGEVQDLIAVVWHQDGTIETLYGAPDEVTKVMGAVHSSSDGLTWTKSGEVLPGVEFPGAEAFITITNPFTGQTAEVANTLPPLSNIGAPYGVVFIVPYGPEEGPMMLSAAFGGSEGTYIATSTDGVSWSPDKLEGSRTGAAVAYGEGRWIGFGEQFPVSDIINMTSLDNGASWTSVLASPVFFTGSVEIAPAFGKGIFCHVQGGKIYTSTDGLTWTESPQALGATNFARVIY